MTPPPLSDAAGGLLYLLGGRPGTPSGYWVTPAESLTDAWVLVTPLRTQQRVATRKFKETVITELVQQGLVRWTEADEDIPPYLCGTMTRESWFRGRKGRRIEVAAGHG
jgi:hypothetical protein